MINFKENTTLVGISELRTKMDQILTASRKNRVVIEKRHKPYAVIMDAKKFDEMENRLDFLEDMVLSFLAIDREKNSKSTDYIDIDAAILKIRSR